MQEEKFDLNRIRADTNLVSFLSSLGYEPQRYSGGEHFYFSMLREGERTPSFCVNEKLGLWYDHGMGKGGNIIDFACAYWPGLTFKEVLNQLTEVTGLSAADPLASSYLPVQLELPLRHPNYEIGEDKPLGSNVIITNYLKSRGIFGAAGDHLRELYYTISSGEGKRMSFFAAGWQNELGGWELRNASFKGCLGKKGINVIQNNVNKLAIFEGMMDYLSWRTQFPQDNATIIILNSLSMLSQAIKKARDYPIIDIFFDHDVAGRKATESLNLQLPWARDCSSKYQGFNDYNELIQAGLSVPKRNVLSVEMQEERRVINR